MHKAPQLDLMGWFTNTPTSGPTQDMLSVHRQFLKVNDSAVLLAFHPSLVGHLSSGGAKLPLTIYETVSDGEADAGIDDADKMQDTEDSLQDIKFREVPYSIETGEAEMISVDFVAKGGGSAATAAKSSEKDSSLRIEAEKTKGKSGSGKSEQTEVNGVVPDSVLSTEEEDRLYSHAAGLLLVQSRN